MTPQLLVCENCGRPFARPNEFGPIPKFCRPGCRQAAFRKRGKTEKNRCPSCGKKLN